MITNSLATLHQIIGNYFITLAIFFFFFHPSFLPEEEKLDAFLNAFQT